MSTVTIIHGTNRTDNRSQLVVKHLYGLLAATGVAPTVVTPTDVLTSPVTARFKDLPVLTEEQERWKQVVAETDTFILVIPEYNHSFPGEWKLLMDTLFGEYFGKRIFVATVSDGAFGGVRVMEQILPVLVNLRLMIAPQRLHVKNVPELFSNDGSAIDQDFIDRAHAFIDAAVKAA